MIKGEEWFMIRDLYKKGLSISEISRKTKHDRKTIRRIISSDQIPKMKERPQRPSKLDPFKGYLRKRMDLGVFNCVKLLREIKEMGYQGQYSILKDYIKPFRQSQKAVIRYETLPGYQAQVDWGTVGKMYDERGVLKTVYCFLLTLSYSRYMYIEFTFRADTRAFIRGHLNAFNYFGGLTERILYDNTKCAKLVYEDGSTTLNPLFSDFASCFCFTPKFCKPYSPQTKGKVESGIKYVKGNFCLGEVFESLEDMNDKRWGWLDKIANSRVHGTTGEVIRKRFEKEKEKLLPLRPHMVFDTSLYSLRKIGRDCLVSYQGCRYSVPHRYASKTCLVKDKEDGFISILVNNQTVANHRLSKEKNRTILVNSHYQGIEAKRASRRKKLPLLNQKDLPQVEARPLSVYEEVAGGNR